MYYSSVTGTDLKYHSLAFIQKKTISETVTVYPVYKLNQIDIILYLSLQYIFIFQYTSVNFVH